MTRHELGEVSLAAGRAGEAADVVLEDLERIPENAWSEDGLARAVALLEMSEGGPALFSDDVSEPRPPVEGGLDR